MQGTTTYTPGPFSTLSPQPSTLGPGRLSPATHLHKAGAVCSHSCWRCHPGFPGCWHFAKLLWVPTAVGFISSEERSFSEAGALGHRLWQHWQRIPPLIQLEVLHQNTKQTSEPLSPLEWGPAGKLSWESEGRQNSTAQLETWYSKSRARLSLLILLKLCSPLELPMLSIFNGHSLFNKNQ